MGIDLEADSSALRHRAIHTSENQIYILARRKHFARRKRENAGCAGELFAPCTILHQLIFAGGMPVPFRCHLNPAHIRLVLRKEYRIGEKILLLVGFSCEDGVWLSVGGIVFQIEHMDGTLLGSVYSSACQIALRRHDHCLLGSCPAKIHHTILVGFEGFVADLYNSAGNGLFRISCIDQYMVLVDAHTIFPQLLRSVPVKVADLQRIQKQIVHDLFCIIIPVIIGMLNGQTGRNDPAFAQRVFHQGGIIRFTGANQDICTCRQSGFDKFRMTAICREPHLILFPLHHCAISVRKSRSQNGVLRIRYIIILCIVQDLFNIAGKRTGQIAVSPAPVRCAKHNHAAERSIQLHVILEFQIVVVGGKRLIVRKDDHGVILQFNIQKFRCGDLLIVHADISKHFGIRIGVPGEIVLDQQNLFLGGCLLCGADADLGKELHLRRDGKHGGARNRGDLF